MNRCVGTRPICFGTTLNHIRERVPHMTSTGYHCQECTWTVNTDDIGEMSSQALDHYDETGHQVEYDTDRTH